MTKLTRRMVVAMGVLALAHEASAQACPGVAPWVFDDVAASDPFCSYITKIANQGVTLGCIVIDANHRLYCPNDTVSRGQMAAYMARLGDAVFAQGGNTFGAPAILGTKDAQPFELHVGGVRAWRIERGGPSVNLIAGSVDNFLAVGIVGATIAGGGGLTTDANRVGGDYSTVGGGRANIAADAYATVGGGWTNWAMGPDSVIAGGSFSVASADSASVGGGYSNSANGVASTVGGGWDGVASGYAAVVAGGQSNSATGNHSLVSGGHLNQATGLHAIVVGGSENVASGIHSGVLGGEANNAFAPYSFVLGYNGITTINGTGSFVYSDSSAGQFGSAAPNQFLVGATGGIGLYTSKTYASGCKIAAGGAQWQCFSSRDGKTDVASIDPTDILDRVVALPIASWRYRGESAHIRHLGPMAQDFHAAFGLGDENTSIGVLDGSGVALAAIQGLHAQLRERDGAIAALRSELAELAAVVAALREGARR